MAWSPVTSALAPLKDLEISVGAIIINDPPLIMVPELVTTLEVPIIDGICINPYPYDVPIICEFGLFAWFSEHVQTHFSVDFGTIQKP
ncbi:hypothetical protein LOZ80_20005 [Paenibacillus sp. HWE-109]|nr:hypothetical protein [Paenibacillus sp. HWE-109]UKS23929.1 hypothetical protein LOZ80_20005 [Paenibacillus sp. HWE-109]